MNREIKFRGKCTDNGEWVAGSLLQDDYGNCMIVGFIDHHEQWYSVSPETVGQFTGLRDRNGEDIYEGDILMCIGQRKDNNGREYFRKVIFKNGSFCMSVLEYNSDSTLYSHAVNGKLNWEVIGNIHDNPELMKGGAQ